MIAGDQYLVANCTSVVIDTQQHVASCASTFADDQHPRASCGFMYTDAQHPKINGAPMNVDAPFILNISISKKNFANGRDFVPSAADGVSHLSEHVLPAAYHPHQRTLTNVPPSSKIKMPPISWRQKKAEAIKNIRILQIIEEKDEKYQLDQ